MNNRAQLKSKLPYSLSIKFAQIISVSEYSRRLILNFKSSSKFGDFTVFGFTYNPSVVLQRLSSMLGIAPLTFEIGSLGKIFFYTSYGDVAESDEAIVLKLGFLRSTTKSILTAQQLLEQKLVEPKSIDTDAFSGNGLVVSLSKNEPILSAFQTLIAVPQLYYSNSLDGIVCSDDLRCLVSIIPNCELDETILPQHFLFRSVYGSSTYFRGVKRLIPGNYLKWEENKFEIKLCRNLDAITEEGKYIRDNTHALSQVSDVLDSVVGDYTTQVENAGQGLANLLSGGVDSTLIQYYINSKSSHQPRRSISFAIKIPNFEFEERYARMASELMHTEHTFVNYTPKDYPCLLTRAVEILAQPPNLETEPSFLAIAEFIQGAHWPERYYFTGQAGDTLFGDKSARKLKALQLLSKIPLAVPILRGMGSILEPISARSHMMIRGAEILASNNNPDSYCLPRKQNGCICLGRKLGYDSSIFRRPGIKAGIGRPTKIISTILNFCTLSR